MRGEAELRFSSWAETAGPGLLRFAWSLTGNRPDAEDLLQTALTKLYVGWRRAEATADLDAYARRVIVNAAIDAHRFRRRRPAEASLAAGADPSAADHADSVVAADSLQTLLSGLPMSQRAVLALRFGEDRTERETADLLGISVGTVKSHTARALTTLRRRESAAAELTEDGHANR